MTLMSVAKPWMEALPDPEMSHSLLGLPGLLFSQAISLVTGGSQAAAAAWGAGSPTKEASTRLTVRETASPNRARADLQDDDTATLTTLPLSR
ncbi:hypothetical protein GCM10009841_31500 [Microlunatus panaciterrae]